MCEILKKKMEIRLDPDKLYYGIKEVADMFGVSKSLLRYWETEFPSLKPHKNSKGDRRFTKQNIQHLQLIHSLVKEKGYTLEGAKKEIANLRSRQKLKKQLIKKLEQIHKGLNELSKEL